MILSHKSKVEEVPVLWFVKRTYVRYEWLCVLLVYLLCFKVLGNFELSWVESRTSVIQSKGEATKTHSIGTFPPTWTAVQRQQSRLLEETIQSEEWSLVKFSILLFWRERLSAFYQAKRAQALTGFLQDQSSVSTVFFGPNKAL